MKRFKKISLFFLGGVLLTLIIVLSSCTVKVTPPPQPYVPKWHVIIDNAHTGWLNCAGFWEDGQFVHPSFSLPKAAKLKIDVEASNGDLPPSNFDIYIMTQDQYNNYYEIWDNNGNIGNASSMYEWDLTQYYYDYLWEYNLYKITNQLAKGNYYIVLANNYYEFGRGVYGCANYSLSAYY